MNDFQKDIDNRTNLALPDRFELLLSCFDKSVKEQKPELFGINVFKLREIVPVSTSTRPAGMKVPLPGMVNIRDQVIPVIDLSTVMDCKSETGLNILSIIGYAHNVQAFAIESMENTIRLGWQRAHTAERAVNGRYITSIACLDDSKETNNLALVLDVEQTLYGIVPASHDLRITDLKTSKFNITPGAVAIVTDDSKVARTILGKGFNATEILHLMHITGQNTWERIQQLSAEAQAEGKSVSKKIALALADLEMPETDGLTLIRKMKTDERLKKIPVVIRSSLSGSADKDHVRCIKADGCVAKFEVNELSSATQEAMDRTAKGISGPPVSRQLLN